MMIMTVTVTITMTLIKEAINDDVVADGDDDDVDYGHGE